MIGFPLQGLLTSQPSLSTGNISALAGIDNNEKVYQLSSPIQKGNSGGPVFNKQGLVLGIVQSKLNAIKVARSTGDIPQNINFAIKSSQILEFLKKNAVKVSVEKGNKYISTPDIAEQAMKYTYKLSCSGYALMM